MNPSSVLWPRAAVAALFLCAAPAARAQTDLGARLDEHLQRLVPWGFSGSVLVARADRVVLAAGYGFADRARASANTAQTQFPLGALSQQFTAAAVLLLADEGQLSLDDHLGSRLDGVPQDKQGITLRHLLLQQSGLPLDVGGPFDRVEAKEDALARVLGAPLLFSPGARSSVSNAGYALLCAVVEKTSGTSFEDFVRENILKRSGMHGTVFIGDPRATELTLARSYGDERDGESPAAWQPSWPLRGVGAMACSVGDLYRWERALKPDVLLSARAVELMHSPGLGNAAMGLQIERGESGKRVAQRGSQLAGFQSEIRRGLDDPLSWALLLNEPMPAAVMHVEALLSGKTVALPPEVAALDGRMGAAAAGTYELPGGGRFRVSFDRGRLSVAAENQGGVDALSQPTADEQAWAADAGRRTLALCEALRGRDFPAIAAMLGRTAQEVDGQLGSWWRRLEDRLGGSGAPKLVASLARAETVVARLEFERGSELVWFAWNGGSLRSFQPGPAIFQSSGLWPAKDGGFVSYDPASFTQRRLALMLRADGSVRGLSFPADGGDASELGARRLD